ncbi:MAG: hypothetical protein L0332_24785 [Chloroflexi bacterium]|nr:hypothetical protein [Chloroflexota bacterium]MCI0576880.1 hypothetical protein [Chloroflexota bacterium]MCI0646466.1 hypothetical protein [Chloroflexota bacterium]MCI0729913.1 hypothetical protein [Chloroflexota bacterium]
MTDENHYRAYLLRLQRGQGQLHWRVTLQNAHTGEVLKFATERALLNHLLDVLSLDLPVDKDASQAPPDGLGSNRV